MAYVRRLKSGLWAGTYYTGRKLCSGNPERLTVTDPLEGVVRAICAENEVDVRRRVWLDPRGAERTVASVWDEYAHTRQIQQASRDRDDSHWRNHVKPKWGETPLGDIVKLDVAEWVQRQEKDGVGAWTIVASLNVLKAALELAVDAGLINGNAARRVKAPLPAKSPERIITPDERKVILARADDLFPGQRGGRLFVETLADTGCRYEEVAAVKKEAIDLRRKVINVGPVQERNGRIRQFPKGARSQDSAGFRAVPLGDDLCDILKPVLESTAPGERVYTAPRGGALLYPTWRSRVWEAIVKVAILDPATGKPTGEWEPLVREPLPTAHDWRHTFGTRLGDAGLERHHIMALMGHDDYRSSHRYTHSEEDERLKRARKAMGW